MGDGFGCGIGVLQRAACLVVGRVAALLSSLVARRWVGFNALWRFWLGGLVCWSDGGGLVLWLFVGPARVCLLDFFCAGVRFCLLLGPCPCFVSFLCLGLCVLGDGALGLGSFVRAGHLCVLIRIWAEGGVGALLGLFGPLSGIVC